MKYAISWTIVALAGIALTSYVAGNSGYDLQVAFIGACTIAALCKAITTWKDYKDEDVRK